ncbi:hypothetical protein ACKS0A_06261 [Histoplasma ohiense]
MFPTRAPPIGFPVRLAKDETANITPVRIPIWRTSEICATNAGLRETKAPEVKPKKAENRRMGMLPRAGSQRARTIMTFSTLVITMILKRPKTSAAWPGRIRPTVLYMVA